MPVNVPNLLTWLRILAIPLLVAIFYLPDRWLEPAGEEPRPPRSSSSARR